MARYFTLDEVNRLVPQVAAGFTRVLQLRTQIRPVYKRLEEAGFAPERSDFEVAIDGAAGDVLRDRAAFKSLVEMLNEEVEAIGETGAVIKDLDSGLCDWLACRRGKDIWLCWRIGEAKIDFWHELETGFSGRRPVAELAGTEATGAPGSATKPSA
jgi:hypothetical protein